MEVVINTFWPDLCVRPGCHDEETGCTERILVPPCPPTASKLWHYWSVVRGQQTIVQAFDKMYFCELIDAFDGVIEEKDVTAVFYHDENQTVGRMALANKMVKIVLNNKTPRIYTAALLTKPQYLALLSKMRARWDNTSPERKCQTWAVKPTPDKKIESFGRLPLKNRIYFSQYIKLPAQANAILAKNNTRIAVYVNERGQSNREYRNGDWHVYACKNRNQVAVRVAALMAEENCVLIKFDVETRTKLRHPSPRPLVGPYASVLPLFLECANTLRRTLSYQNHDGVGPDKDGDPLESQGLLVNVPVSLRGEADRMYRAIIAEEYVNKNPVDGYLEMAEASNSAGFLFQL
jgi:hypothetical protein